MEFIIDSDQSFLFESKGVVEFVDFFSEKEMNKLSASIESVLQKRKRMEDFQEPYLAGRDLWRESQDLKRMLLKGNLGKVASQLIHQKRLRLAADQWISGGQAVPLVKTLVESFPFQGIELGIMIALNNA